MMPTIILPVLPKRASSKRSENGYLMKSEHRLRKTFAGMVAVTAALAAARALPTDADIPRVDLAQVVGRTVCPLAVLVDEDPLRLPRRIKFMACERAPERRCPAATDAAGVCCGRRGRATRCVEVFDNVVVQYLAAPDADPRNATQAVIQVPVGCACVLHQGTPARLDD